MAKAPQHNEKGSKAARFTDGSDKPWSNVRGRSAKKLREFRAAVIDKRS